VQQRLLERDVHGLARIEEIGESSRAALEPSMEMEASSGLSPKRATFDQLQDRLVVTV